jgi:hypothetical protein
MLLPDNIRPELTIYYNGAIILKELEIKNKYDIIDLYQKVKETNDMSFVTFMLSIDWLYLLQVAIINQNGEIEICS